MDSSADARTLFSPTPLVTGDSVRQRAGLIAVRSQSWLRALHIRSWLAGVLVLGTLVRVALLPWWQGQDFDVLDIATRATLNGANIYRHHPDYPSGPFAYFPLFLYVELPFQWLSVNLGIPFRILGKLPILLADLVCARLIAQLARRHGSSEAMAAGAAALFFLNPLVIYNGVFYGRFDSVACALLLAACLRVARDGMAGRWSIVLLACAVAVKTFPGFVLAGFARRVRTGRARAALVFAAALALICLPYLVSLRQLYDDIFLYDVSKQPAHLGWQQFLPGFVMREHGFVVGYGLLAGFVLATVLLARIRDLRVYVALVLVLFLLCNKDVLEQYLTWPLPWLGLLAVRGERRVARASIALAAVLSLVGMLTNRSISPFGGAPQLVVWILAAANVAFIVIVLRAEFTARKPERQQARQPVATAAQ